MQPLSALTGDAVDRPAALRVAGERERPLGEPAEVADVDRGRRARGVDEHPVLDPDRHAVLGAEDRADERQPASRASMIVQCSSAWTSSDRRQATRRVVMRYSLARAGRRRAPRLTAPPAKSARRPRQSSREQPVEVLVGPLRPLAIALPRSVPSRGNPSRSSSRHEPSFRVSQSAHTLCLTRSSNR